MTKVSSIAIEPKSSRGTFSSIAIIKSQKRQLNILHCWLTVGVTGKSVGHFLDLVQSRSN